MEKRIDLGYSRLYVLDATPRGFGAEYIRVYIVDGDEHAVAVVETGPASVAESVAKAVAEIADGRQVEIILTHVHIDHGGGAGRVARLLAEQGLQVAIWAHPRGAPHIADPLKLWKASNKALGETALVYGEPEPAPS
ncbi:MAG TPA: MBL fold metallo-hydrolase, partial [Pyrodictium sp.]|nr:MBL fold metallo-hydrolase [Pyrodictium sp.]